MNTNLNTIETTQETILATQSKILAAQAMILASLEKLDLVLANQGRFEQFFENKGKLGHVVGNSLEGTGKGLNA